MMSFLGCSDQAIAVANGVTTLALLEHLVEKKDSDGGRCARRPSNAASNVSSRAPMSAPSE